jgi:hypothetical protein
LLQNSDVKRSAITVEKQLGDGHNIEPISPPLRLPFHLQSLHLARENPLPQSSVDGQITVAVQHHALTS